MMLLLILELNELLHEVKDEGNNGRRANNPAFVSSQREHTDRH